jgi:hypothetical protein
MVGKRNSNEELGRLGVEVDLIIAKGFAAGANGESCVSHPDNALRMHINRYRVEPISQAVAR